MFFYLLELEFLLKSEIFKGTITYFNLNTYHIVVFFDCYYVAMYGIKMLYLIKFEKVFRCMLGIINLNIIVEEMKNTNIGM